MPVDCINQMLMTSVRGVEAKTCGIRNAPCPHPKECLCAGDPDPARRYNRNYIAYDVPDEDPTVTVQVGSELWKTIGPQTGKL